MDDGIDLREYFSLVAKHWIIIVAGVIAGLFLAIAFTWLSAPVYESEVTLMVSQKSTGTLDDSSVDAYQGLLISERLTTTYSRMVERESFLEIAAESVGIPDEGQSLLSKVTANPINDTSMLTVLARDESPKLAADLANAIGEKLVVEVEEVNESGANSQAGSIIVVSVVNLARPSKSAVSPKPTLNLILGMFIGLLVGLVAAFTRDHLDTRIKDVGDLEKTLDDVPVIARIPSVEDGRVDRLVVHANSQTVASESYRALRTSIGYLNFDGSMRVLVFTSANPQEGKTTVASNVSAALAHAGEKVVAVGADMRRPRLHKAFSVRSDVGLSSVLISAVGIDEAIQPTGTEGLYVLPAGPIPPNPAELLGSKRMSDLIQKLSSSYDYVIIDAPPVLQVTDTMVLGSIADGLILVSRAGMSERGSVEGAIAGLRQLRSKLIGAVLNGVKLDSRQKYSYSAHD